MPPAKLALRALSSLMGDAAAFNELILQWLSASPTARQIDREVGDLCSDVLGASEPWLTYLRYDPQLDRDWLKDRLGLDLRDDQVESVRKMDDPKNLDQLARVGNATAKLVKEEHFDARFRHLTTPRGRAARRTESPETIGGDHVRLHRAAVRNQERDRFRQGSPGADRPGDGTVGPAGDTTEPIARAGNIRADMFELLAKADLVIADISIHNANVFYELGARHALRDKRTFLIRSRSDEVPFDLRTDRYLEYDKDEPGRERRGAGDGAPADHREAGDGQPDLPAGAQARAPGLDAARRRARGLPRGGREGRTRPVPRRSRAAVAGGAGVRLGIGGAAPGRPRPVPPQGMGGRAGDVGSGQGRGSRATTRPTSSSAPSINVSAILRHRTLR